MLSVRRRAPPAFVAGICYQVIIRGNGRRAEFHNHGDYQAFLCQTFLALGPTEYAIDKARLGNSRNNRGALRTERLVGGSIAN